MTVQPAPVVAAPRQPTGRARSARNARRHGLAVCEATEAEVSAFVDEILRPSVPRWAAHLPALEIPFADYARAHLRVMAVDRAFDRNQRAVATDPLRILAAVAALPGVMRYRAEAVAQRRKALRRILLALETPPGPEQAP
jgi:hypothetical protein